MIMDIKNIIMLVSIILEIKTERIKKTHTCLS